MLKKTGENSKVFLKAILQKFQEIVILQSKTLARDHNIYYGNTLIKE